MKEKKSCVKSSPQEQSLSSTNSIIIIPEPDVYLPDDCWEHVFSFIISQPEDKNKLKFKSLSIVSKQFLSITNRLIFSMKIDHLHLCYLSRFFHRFSNLNSLDLSFGYRDLDAAIALALRDRPSLKSLSISRIDLTHANYINSYYIDSFVSLKSLNSLKFSCSEISDHLLYAIAREALPLKTFVLQNCTGGYSYHGIYSLLSKCHGIQYLGLQDVDFLNNHHLSRFSLLLPDLLSINLSGRSKLTESALFVLANCHSLGEITMEHTRKEREENSDALKDFDVNPRLKFLHLFSNLFINDHTIPLFASMFPSLQLLDLSYCHGISKNGISQLLSRCSKLTHLHLTYCGKVTRFKLNFVVPQLELLNLSGTFVDDKTLYEISKSCGGLLKLYLISCKYVTEKGVMWLVKKCKQLKEIDLRGCDAVNAEVILSMLSPRSSLEKDSCSSDVLLKF
ncbi:uncharacterized protein LOC127130227 [Lathyrus oleraceus]|uniref:uncharacterized protein LOC127130227 n=1 Tax=Pisum sativum TaxID=3888 RepID=UPI001FC48F06|nr:uncharacterized protein LOC127130227 [Pisum sativum]